MVVGICRIELTVYGTASLKEKRMVIQSLIRKLRNLGTLSVAEVDYHDKWQRSALGLATVASDQQRARKGLQQGISLLENDHRVEILRIDEETENFDYENN